MFKNVVVPLDGSEFAERAIGPAATLATQTGASVVLVNSTSPVGVSEREEYLNDLVAGRQEVSALTDRGVTWKAQVRWDDAPLAALVSEIESRDSSLACIASHARGPLAQTTFGSMTVALVRSTSMPTVIVGPRCITAPMAYDEVVVPIDGSRLSEAALPVAVEWAKALDLKMHVVQVVDRHATEVAHAAGIPPGDIQEEGYVSHISHGLEGQGVSATWDVLHDESAARGIARCVRERPSALIVMTTHGRSGINLLRFGSVATSVVHQAECPVLLVPSGS